MHALVDVKMLTLPTGMASPRQTHSSGLRSLAAHYISQILVQREVPS